MQQRPEAELDIECFHNWFLVGITDSVTGAKWDYQMIPGYPLDTAAITALAQHYTLITFNGTNYDVPMLMGALAGMDNAQLKELNDNIILRGWKPWDVFKRFRCYPPDWFDHIDVSEPTPGVRVSLKQYACRMHSARVQDSPVDLNKPLPMEHVVEEIEYCRNDRSVTHELRMAIEERIDIRKRLTERYGVDLRSKSDAQMAEAMVKVDWGRRMRASLERWNAEASGQCVSQEPYEHLEVSSFDTDYQGNPKPIVPHYPHGYSFKVKLPDYLNFVTPYMRDFHALVADCDFIVSDKEEAELLGMDGKNIRTGVLIPDALRGRDIIIGNSKYRVGIGGLHSQESSRGVRSIPGRQTLRTADVASYYPSLILNAGMNPSQLGSLFTAIYRGFYDDRIMAKGEVKKHPKDSARYNELVTMRDGYKIVLNGTFGKLFSRYSIFYAPEFGIAVTIGGQLSLLMLIERLELSGISVVSANTDGIEMLIPTGYERIADDIIDWWQSVTSLVMEQESYLALYSRDVNNYVSLHFDGSVKPKGVYGESGVLKNKHPDLDVCSEAVIDFLVRGTPLAQTIHACTDIRKFIRVRGAKGGAVWFRNGHDHFIEQDGARVLHGGVYMGRAVRWYYAVGSADYIVDGKSNNKVAGSDGARPCMDLPEVLPTDIDYRYYVTTAEKMLTEIGYVNQ